MPVPTRFRRTTVLAAAAPLAALVLGAATLDPRAVTVTLTPDDAKVLVAEALAPNGAQSGSVRVRVDSLYGAGDRVHLVGVAEAGPIACALRLDGRPALLSNRITLTDLNATTQPRWDCQMALGLARSYIADALTQRPWDLNRRLARASRDSTLEGPRLPVAGCVREDQLQLTSVTVAPPGLRVEVLVRERPAGAGCP